MDTSMMIMDITTSSSTSVKPLFVFSRCIKLLSIVALTSRVPDSK